MRLRFVPFFNLGIMIYNNKICIVTEEFKPSKKGGIATWSHGLANYFAKEGYL